MKDFLKLMYKHCFNFAVLSFYYHFMSYLYWINEWMNEIVLIILFMNLLILDIKWDMYG